MIPPDPSVWSATAVRSPVSGERATNSASSTRIAPPLSIRSSAPTSCPSNLESDPNL